MDDKVRDKVVTTNGFVCHIMTRTPVNIGDSAVLGDGRRGTPKDNLRLFWVSMARFRFDRKPVAGRRPLSRCRKQTVKEVTMLVAP